MYGLDYSRRLKCQGYNIANVKCSPVVIIYYINMLFPILDSSQIQILFYCEYIFRISKKFSNKVLKVRCNSFHIYLPETLNLTEFHNLILSRHPIQYLIIHYERWLFKSEYSAQNAVNYAYGIVLECKLIFILCNVMC